MNLRTADAVRQRIQVSQLVTRLHNHVFGDTPMTQTQVDSAKFLINKAMPNPPESRIITGPDGGEIPVCMRLTFVRP